MALEVKEYDKSNLDLELLISSGVTQSNLFNLRGVNFNNLKNRDEACKYFKIAADKGDKDAIGNYNKFCQTGEKPHN